MCAWLRLGAAAVNAPLVSLALFSTQTWGVLASSTFTMSTAYQRFCLTGLIFGAPTPTALYIRLPSGAGTFDIDDVAIQYLAGLFFPPAPPPLPPPNPVPVFEGPDPGMVLQFQSSFEDSNCVECPVDGFWVSRVTVGSTGPVANINWQSYRAGRTGYTGLSVQVVTATAVDYNDILRMESPSLPLDALHTYKFCVWVRLADVSVGTTVNTTMTSLDPLANYGVVQRSNVTITTTWSRACQEDVSISVDTQIQWNIDLNIRSGVTYFFDDAMLQYDNITVLSPPPPPPSPPSPPPTTPTGDWPRSNALPPMVTTPWAGPYTPSTREVLRTWGFESGPDGFSVYRFNTAKSWVDFYSAESARTGSRGLQVGITNVVGSADWHVLMQSPIIDLPTSRAFSFCIWARIGQGSPANVTTTNLNIALLNSSQNQVAGTPSPGGAPGDGDTSPWPVVLTRTWKRFCLADAQSRLSTTGRFEIGLGRKLGNFQFDDFSIEYDTLDVNYMSVSGTAARIEAYRKGDLTVKFVNAAGQPLSPTALTSSSVFMKRHDFHFGAAYDISQVPAGDREWYTKTFLSHFNALSPDYSLKWLTYEPFKGSQAGAIAMENDIMSLAEDNDLVHVRGHTMEWYYGDAKYSNHWSRTEGNTTDEICANYRVSLKKRIQDIATQFKGRFHSYDVWNEIFHLRQFALKCQIFTPVNNVTVFHEAFRWIHAIDPGAKLCINDFDILAGGLDSRWRQMYQTIVDLRAAGVPVNCVGIQAYLTPGLVSMELVNLRLEQLGKLGVEVHLSEFLFPDNFNNGPGANMMDQATLANTYEMYLKAWFSHPYVDGIYNWGFWDGRTFVENSGLYFINKTEKAAARTVRRLINQEWWTPTIYANATQRSSATISFRGFFAKYNFLATVGNTIYSGTVNFKQIWGRNQTVTVRLPV